MSRDLEHSSDVDISSRPLAARESQETLVLHREKVRAINAEFHALAMRGALRTMTEHVRGVIGAMGLLSPEARTCLIDDDTEVYDPLLLAEIGYAATHATSRREFDQIIGLHNRAFHGDLRWVALAHRYSRIRDRISLPMHRTALRSAFRSLKADRGGACDCPICEACREGIGTSA